MRARDEPTEVRAAAAWAAHGLDDGDAREALAAAARDDVAPVADNARAALALASAGRRSKVEVWRGARLRARDGTAVGGQWVAISVEHAGDVWAMTDDAGVLRVLAPAGPVQLRVPGSLLRAE